MSMPDLLEYAPVKRTLADLATSYWLRDLLISASSRDPVDTLADLDAARDLLASYLGALVAPHYHRASASQSPDGH